MGKEFDLIIRNGTVILSNCLTAASIAIADGKIIAVDAEIPGSAKTEIDATNLHIFPGLIDIHVHFNDPGRSDWEGILTGSAALAAGGGTLFFDMPLNSSPPVLDAESFDKKIAAATNKSQTDFALWGGLTPQNLDHMESLADRGVVGFKAFMSGSGIDDFPRADDLTLYRGMQKAKQLNLPIAVHAESESITTALTAEALRRQQNLHPGLFKLPPHRRRSRSRRAHDHPRRGDRLPSPHRSRHQQLPQHRTSPPRRRPWPVRRHLPKPAPTI